VSNAILDASAFLAYLYDESGAEVVESAIIQGVYMSAINWAEVLSKVSDKGEDPESLTVQLQNKGLIGESFEILSTTEADALLIAQLRPLTKNIGLSLGDRACLALGKRLELPVLTSDKIWANINLGIQVTIIR